MARTFFDLPNDMIHKIMDMRVTLELDDDPYLKISHTEELCFYCGDTRVEHRIRNNKINYKFCNFCVGYDNVVDTTNHSRCYNLYKNYMSLQGIEMVHFETFFHDIMEEDVRDSIKNPDEFKRIFQTYLEFIPDEDDSDSDIDDGYAFDWGDSEDEVESA